MSENRKFAALAGLRHQHTDELKEIPSSAPPPLRGPGRPAGKRSNPEFRPSTILLRKNTKRMAVRKLEDTDSRQDLSELIDDLLTKWIQQS